MPALGHGFILRTAERNRADVAPALIPDVFSDDPLQLPWTIIDGVAAAGDATRLRDLAR